MRKRDFCLCENKHADQLRSKLISAFVFATRIVQFLFLLNLKFVSHLVGRPVFSRRGSNDTQGLGKRCKHRSDCCGQIGEVGSMSQLGIGTKAYPGPEVIKHFLCSTQLRLKFILLINVKMPTIVGILTFMSRINY